MSVESGLLCCGTPFGFVRVEDVSDEIELKCVLDTCVRLHLLDFGFHMKLQCLSKVGLELICHFLSVVEFPWLD